MKAHYSPVWIESQARTGHINTKRIPHSTSETSKIQGLALMYESELHAQLIPIRIHIIDHCPIIPIAIQTQAT